MRHRATQTTHNRQYGLTLIETMVAMTISSVLILGSIQMYTQARSNYRTMESVARMQENLRFSVDILDDDVRLAGFWGKAGSANAELLNGDTVTITCDGVDVTDFVMNTEVPNDNRVTPIEGLQQFDDLPDGCQGTKPRDNSDVLIVRHAVVAEDPPVGAQPNVVQVQSNSSLGTFFDDGVAPTADATINNQIFDVSFNAYYVSDESKYDENLPSLRRLSLVGNRIEDQEIIPGVENLQVQLGIDTTGSLDDPQIEMYVDGDDPRIGTGTIVSARLWLLVRSETNEAGLGYEDTKGPYKTPDASDLEVGPSIDADDYPPTYRRTALSRTIVLHNLAD